MTDLNVPPLLPRRDDPRPGSVPAFGVMNLGFGALGTLWNPAVVALILALAHADPDDPGSFRLLHDARYRAFLFASTALATIACLGQVASGIGLLRGKRWGWWLAIAYAAFSLIHPFADFLGDYLLGTHRELIQAGRAGDREQVHSIMIEGAGLLIYGGLTMIYPAILLYAMLRPDVRRWFRSRRPIGGAAPPP